MNSIGSFIAFKYTFSKQFVITIVGIEDKQNQLIDVIKINYNFTFFICTRYIMNANEPICQSLKHRLSNIQTNYRPTNDSTSHSDDISYKHQNKRVQ